MENEVLRNVLLGFILLVSETQGVALKCHKNGIFKPTADEKTDCLNCDYYTCVYYHQLNRWLVQPWNCSASSQFDDTIKRCVRNEASSSPNPMPPLEPPVIVGRTLAQDERVYYTVKVFPPGITVITNLSQGSVAIFYSYTNMHPDEFDYDGTLDPASDTTIPHQDVLVERAGESRNMKSYQHRLEGTLVYISVIGLSPTNTFNLRIVVSTSPVSTTTTAVSTTKSTNDTNPPPATNPPITLDPENDPVTVVDSISQNEINYYIVEVPLEGLNVSMDLSEGSIEGLFSYRNPTPDKLNNDGSLNPNGTSFIPYRQPGFLYRYQQRLLRIRVYISLRGLSPLNKFVLRIFINSLTTTTPTTTTTIDATNSTTSASPNSTLGPTNSTSGSTPLPTDNNPINPTTDKDNNP